MSKRQSKTGVPHLVFQAKTGFQYYLTFPKHFALSPKLPAQVRWSLGYDESLARELANYLNPRLQQLIDKADALRDEHMSEFVLADLAAYHAEIAQILESSKRIWAHRPSPSALAKKDPMPGYERLITAGPPGAGPAQR